MNQFVVSLKDVGLDKEHDKRRDLARAAKGQQARHKGSKIGAQKLKQPGPNDKMVSGKFIVKW